jgi:O-antigen/teichoic acid export membrane protein
LPGKTVALGSSTALLSFASAASLADASADGGAPQQQLFSLSGSVTFTAGSSANTLVGTFDATMSVGPTAASTVKVQGSFTANSCGDY